MKIIISLILFNFSLSAAEFIIGQPCSNYSMLYKHYNKTNLSVGELTIKLLNESNIPFEGNDAVIESILGTPSSNEAIDIISTSKMRAYGWCYKLDGEMPTQSAELLKASDYETIYWFYGYTEYDSGHWSENCYEASLIKPEWLCHNDLYW